MTKLPFPHTDPDDWVDRLAEVQTLIAERGPGTELDLLRAEESYLEKQIRNRESNMGAITAPNSPTWVDYRHQNYN